LAEERPLRQAAPATSPYEGEAVSEVLLRNVKEFVEEQGVNTFSRFQESNDISALPI